MSIKGNQERNSITPSTKPFDQGTATITRPSVFVGKIRLITQEDLSICKNTGDRQSLKRLIDLKGVISQQLPKMPKDYITKILFNPKHQSVVATIGGTTIAGACFRCFERKDFAELVFLAVSQRYRERGLGTQILNRLKEQLQCRQITLLLTYADYTATGFFQKQAFEYVDDGPQMKWSGYIKAYQGGALMQCTIDSHFRYSQFKKTITQQRQALIAKIKLFCKSQINYSLRSLQSIRKSHEKGLSALQLQQPTSNTIPEKQFKAEFKHFTENSWLEHVPGLLESGWCSQLQRQLQSTEETSLLLARLYAVDTIRRLPLFKVISEWSRSQGIQFSVSWAGIEKKIINSWQYSEQNEFCADVREIVSRLKRSGRQETRDFQDFELKVQAVLSALMEKRLLIQIDNAFKEQVTSRSKKGNRL